MKKIHYLVSNLDNHNIGVLTLKVKNTNNGIEILEAVLKNKGLKEMLNGQFGSNDVSFEEKDVEVMISRGAVVMEVTADKGNITDEITLEQTFLY